MIDTMRKVSPEDLLQPLLLQLALILTAARVCAWLARRVGQPAAVGEIAAGLALGPSLFGELAPGLFAAVFRPEVAGLPPDASDVLLVKILAVLAQLGLVLLMFLIGLEFDFGHLVADSRAVVLVSALGAAIPFAMGFGLGWLMHPLVTAGQEREIPPLAFCLFIGTALSVTAVPVLGRMMMEWGIARTRLAAVVVSAAAFQDAAGWVLLASVAAAAGRPGHVGAFGMIAGAVLFTAVMVLAVRPLVSRLGRRMLSGDGELGVGGLAALLVLLFLSAAATGLIGIFAILGAFLLGAVLSGEVGLREAAGRRIRDFVTAFFLPVFFACTGLRTDIGTLNTWTMAGLAVAVTAAAVVGKVGGCGLAAWCAGRGWRESACVGVLMNTRGLMELVVVNVGRDLGVIPDTVYCMLVLMALATTLMTAPLLHWLARGTELDAPMRAGERGQTASRSPVEPLTPSPA